MKKILTLAALAAASTGALADWSATWISGTYTGTLGANGTSASSSEPMSSWFGATGPMGSVANAVTALQPQLKTQIDGIVSAQASAAGATFNSSVLTGTLTANSVPYAGLSGVSQIVYSGLTYTARVGISFYTGPFNSVKVNCTDTMTVANLSIGSYYYTATGANVTSGVPSVTPSFTPTHSVSCSSSVDWVPFVGNWVDGMASSTVQGKVAGTSLTFSSSVFAASLPTLPTLTNGIIAAVPTGKFIANGVDLSLYLRANAQYLFAQPYTMTFGTPWPAASSFYVSGVSEPMGVPTKSILTVSFPTAGLNYSLVGNATLRYTWRCPAGTPSGTYCPEP